MLRPALAVLGAVAALPSLPAAAHPHVFVDAAVEAVFGEAGQIVAIRNVWRFDKAYSDFALEGIDTDGDGRISDAELVPLAQLNIDSLGDYGYFTTLSVNGTALNLKTPDEYWLVYEEGQLTLFFSIPLQTPVAPGSGGMVIEVYDPEYFVAFSFAPDAAGVLVGAPAGCTAQYNAPHELDEQTMAALAAVPQDDRALPPALADAALGLAATYAIACR